MRWFRPSPADPHAPIRRRSPWWLAPVLSLIGAAPLCAAAVSGQFPPGSGTTLNHRGSSLATEVASLTTPGAALAPPGSALTRHRPAGAEGDTVPQLMPDWTGVASAPYAVHEPSIPEPVLTAADVSDDFAVFVADPFMFRENGLWYLFMEEYNYEGRIAYATSQDGFHWQYQHQLHLNDGHHLSFPYVFENQGDHYLMPESGATQEITLYRATTFPSAWTRDAVLVQGQDFADPVLMFFHGYWWLFFSHGDNQDCYLYYSADLKSGWRPHPMSPIVYHDPGRARAAGRCLVLANDRVLRLAQDCAHGYGQSVRVFQVDTLTTTRYAEHEVPESPILGPGSEQWNSQGMHTFDPWWDGDHWVASVDGLGPDLWSIGIYVTSPSHPSAVGPAPDSPGLFDAGGTGLRILSCAPNPCSNGTRVPYALGAPADQVRLRILDSCGRLVRTLAAGHVPVGLHRLWWDGRSDGGARLPNGVYFLRLQADGRGASGNVRLIR